MPLLLESPSPHPPSIPTNKMNFDSLPSAVRQKIIGELAKSSSRRRLPRYATVSKEWQKAIEKVTFAELYLTDGRVIDVGKIMTRRRQSHLRFIMCHVMLGAYADHKSPETNSQHRESTRVLNDYMLNLFKVMAKWRPQDAPSVGTHLKIVINSPSDETSNKTWGDHPQNRRARAALAQIGVSSDSLPPVATISGLACSGRHLELASVTLLITKLPNLRNLDVEMEHDTKDSRDVEQRAEFISSLAYYAPNVTNLRLHRPINHVESHKSPSHEQRSLFHTRLRNFTQRCGTVTFDDCVYAREFFGPFADVDYQQRRMNPLKDSSALTTANIKARVEKKVEKTTKELCWPHIRKLHIRNSYMLRRPYTRVSSRSAALKVIHEVLLLAGRAIGHMPEVEHVKIRQYVLSDGRLETIILEYMAGESNGGRKGARLVIEGLRPSVPTLDAWKQSVRATRATHLRIDIEGNTSLDSDDSMTED